MKLKKFNEDWMDDELSDTNRRMAELDNEEAIEDNVNAVEQINELVGDLAREIEKNVEEYYREIFILDNDLTKEDVINYLCDALKKL